MVLEADLSGSQRPLQEESQRQLGQLGLDKCTDRLVGEGEDLLALLLPLVVLVGTQSWDVRMVMDTRSKVLGAGAGAELRVSLTREEFSLYLKASW